MDLTQKKDETCPNGFSKVNRFCRDTCGDGSVQLSPQVFQCDDGNTDDGDGWSSKWEIETDFDCIIDPTLNNKSYCVPACGSGTYDPATEACDDGNQNSGDGCENDCTITPGYGWVHPAGQPSFCTPFCGDSFRDVTIPEQCDDGNNLDFDGCSKDCTIEANYICTVNTPPMADTWVTAYPRPVPLSGSFDELTNTIEILFDQEMLDQSLNDTSALLFIDSPNGEITSTFTTSFSGIISL